MRICLIGCGAIVRDMHAPALARYRLEHPETVLAACCDPMTERAEAMRQRLGFARHYLDHREMLRAERPDAVLVAVSETAAPDVGIDVLRAGVPMLIEKPPGRTVAAAARLADAARETGVPCQVAFNRRYMPVLTSLRDKAPADVQLITYEMVRWERREGTFANTAVHAIDAVRCLARADYREVRFSYLEMPQYGAGVCNILMDCVMTSGAQAQLRICPMSGASLERAGLYARNRLLLGFTPAQGSKDAPGRVEDYRDNQPPEITVFPPAEVYENTGFWAEDAAFFDAIAAGTPPAPDIASALNAMRVKECLDRRETVFRIEEGV